MLSGFLAATLAANRTPPSLLKYHTSCSLHLSQLYTSWCQVLQIVVRCIEGFSRLDRA